MSRKALSEALYISSVVQLPTLQIIKHKHWKPNLAVYTSWSNYFFFVMFHKSFLLLATLNCTGFRVLLPSEIQTQGMVSFTSSHGWVGKATFVFLTISVKNRNFYPSLWKFINDDWQYEGSQTSGLFRLLNNLSSNQAILDLGIEKRSFWRHHFPH